MNQRDRLRNAVENQLVKLGRYAEMQLALKAGVSQRTVLNLRRGDNVLAGNAYKLALVCGFKEDEAMKIAREYTETRGRQAKGSAL